MIPGHWLRDFLLLIAIVSWAFPGAGSAAELGLELSGEVDSGRLLLEVSLHPDRPGRFHLEMRGRGVVVRSNPAMDCLETAGDVAVGRFPVEIEDAFRGAGRVEVTALDEERRPYLQQALDFYRGTLESHLDGSFPQASSRITIRGMQQFTDEKTLPTGLPEGQALAMVRAMTAEAINTAEANLASDFRMNPLDGRMGEELRFAAAREALNSGGATEAVQLLEGLKPTRADQANLHAVALETVGQRNSAIAVLEGFLLKYPQTRWARCLHYNLGVLWHESGDPAKAAEQFRKTLELNPNHHGARRMLRDREAIQKP